MGLKHYYVKIAEKVKLYTEKRKIASILNQNMGYFCLKSTILTFLKQIFFLLFKIYFRNQIKLGFLLFCLLCT